MSSELSYSDWKGKEETRHSGELLVGLTPLLFTICTFLRPQTLLNTRIGKRLYLEFNAAKTYEQWRNLAFHNKVFRAIQEFLLFTPTLEQWDWMIEGLGLITLVLLFIKLTSSCRLNYLDSAFLLGLAAVCSMYTFLLSKDVIQFYIYAIAASIISSRLTTPTKNILVVLLFYFEYTVWRKYSALIACFFMLLFAILSLGKWKRWTKWSSRKKTLSVLLLVFVGITIVALFLKQTVPGDYAEIVRMHGETREDRMEGSANTSFRSFFNVTTSSPPWLFALNVMCNAVRILYPIELLSYSPKYWVVGIAQIPYAFYITKALVKGDLSYEPLRTALALYLAFLFASGSFEPDFTTWVRHEVATLPILLLIIQYAKNHALQRSFSSLRQLRNELTNTTIQAIYSRREAA